MNKATDAAIARLAEREGLIVVTRDEDFVALQRPDSLAIVWLWCRNITDAALLELIEPQGRALLARLADGNRLNELR